MCACELLRSVNCQIKKHRIRVISPKTEAKQTVLFRYFPIHSQVHNTHTHTNTNTHTHKIFSLIWKNRAFKCLPGAVHTGALCENGAQTLDDEFRFPLDKNNKPTGSMPAQGARFFLCSPNLIRFHSIALNQNILADPFKKRTVNQNEVVCE